MRINMHVYACLLTTDLNLPQGYLKGSLLQDPGEGVVEGGEVGRRVEFQ